MKLLDLDPHWVGAGGPGITDHDGQPVPKRHGVGMTFACPCGCPNRGYVAFSNPLDGGPPHIRPGQPTWHREGESFATLTLTPSIQRAEPGGCRWHGVITKGVVKTC